MLIPNKLFTNMFKESFDSVKKSDASTGDIEGIVSPYSAKIDSVGLVIDNLNDNEDNVSNKITGLYKKLEYGIRMDSSNFMEDFKKFSGLLEQSFQINNFFTFDTLLQEKLSDILTYAYARLNGGDFRIYEDLTTAKDVTRAIMTKSKSFGLTFLDSNTEDIVQKILLSILFKPKQ